MSANMRALIHKILVVLLLLNYLIGSNFTIAAAHDEPVHNWIIQKAVEYLHLNHPDLFNKYPIYNYLPWLLEGASYADAAGRTCRWKASLFSIVLKGYSGFCDTIHHYGEEGDIHVGLGGIDHATGNTGDLNAKIYASLLFDLAVKFWPGGAIPILGELPHVNGGSTGIGQLDNDLGETDVGGEPFCQLDFPGHKNQCPRWPDWASHYPLENYPAEQIHVAVMYLGWSLHLLGDLSNCGHAINHVGNKGDDNCHSGSEKAAGKFINDDSLRHLPVDPVSILGKNRTYKHSGYPVVGNFFFDCSDLKECSYQLAKKAQQYGASSILGQDFTERATLEVQLDAAIKLTSGLLYAFFQSLPEPEINIDSQADYYLQTGDQVIRQVQFNQVPGMLTASCCEWRYTKNVISTSFILEPKGKFIEMDPPGCLTVPAIHRNWLPGLPSPACKSYEEREYFSLMEKGTGLFLVPSLDSPGMQLSLAGYLDYFSDSFIFYLKSTGNGGYYIIQKSSGLFVCYDINTSGPHPPLMLCKPPSNGEDENYRFRLLESGKRVDVNEDIKSILNFPPSLVFGLFHTYENIDPQGMRYVGLDFLDIKRPWSLHGGDYGMGESEGFYWWMATPQLMDYSRIKVPKGVVFALKHSMNQKETQITLNGFDPSDKTSPDRLPGFRKYFAHDQGTFYYDGQSFREDLDEGYYWYESTGEGFDWATDAAWADRLPRGTVIGLKHTMNGETMSKVLHWNGKIYDPEIDSPPPGYERRGCYDNKLGVKQGYCWYEKVTGVTVVLLDHFIESCGLYQDDCPVHKFSYPRPGVLGDGLETGIAYLGDVYKRIDQSTADPRICQAYCYEDLYCEAWNYSIPGLTKMPGCSLIRTGGWTITINDDSYISGRKYGP